MKDLQKLINSLVREVIEEMSTTASVAGYSTPFAFRKSKGKNKATATAVKLGFSVCEKDSETENEGELLAEDVQLDASKEVNDFKRSLSTAELQLSQKFSAALKEKLLGKNIEIQGSKGYGQFKTKYSLRVVDVSVEDWYGKSDYQLIITGEDKKQYFVDVTVPIRVLDKETGTKPQPAQPAAAPSPKPAAGQVPVKPQAAPASELDKAISK
jgi:hypothetical protein